MNNIKNGCLSGGNVLKKRDNFQSRHYERAIHIWSWWSQRFITNDYV